MVKALLMILVAEISEKLLACIRENSVCIMFILT